MRLRDLIRDVAASTLAAILFEIVQPTLGVPKVALLGAIVGVAQWGIGLIFSGPPSNRDD